MVVYPVPGRRVRCPITKRTVPEGGLTVHEHDIFWLRRLRDGDVTEEPPEPPADGGENPPPPPEPPAPGVKFAARPADIVEPTPPIADKEEGEA